MRRFKGHKGKVPVQFIGVDLDIGHFAGSGKKSA